MGYEANHKGKFVQRLDFLHRETPGVNLSTDFMTQQQIKELSGPVHAYYINQSKEVSHASTR